MRHLLTTHLASLVNSLQYTKYLGRRLAAESEKGACFFASRRAFGESSSRVALLVRHANEDGDGNASTLRSHDSDGELLTICLKRFCGNASNEQISVVLHHLLESRSWNTKGQESNFLDNGEKDASGKLSVECNVVYHELDENAELEDETVGMEAPSAGVDANEVERLLSLVDSKSREKALAEVVDFLDRTGRFCSWSIEKKGRDFEGKAQRLVKFGEFRTACRFVHWLLKSQFQKPLREDSGEDSRVCLATLEAFGEEDSANDSETQLSLKVGKDGLFEEAKEECFSSSTFLFLTLQTRALQKAAATRNASLLPVDRRRKLLSEDECGVFTLTEAVEFLRTQSPLRCMQDPGLTQQLSQWIALSFKEATTRLSEGRALLGNPSTLDSTARSELFAVSAQQRLEEFFLDSPLLSEKASSEASRTLSPFEREHAERCLAVEAAKTLKALSAISYFDVSLLSASCDLLRRLHAWLSLPQICTVLWSLARLGFSDPDLVHRFSVHLQRSRQLAALGPESLFHVSRLLLSLRRLKLRDEGLLLSCADALARCGTRAERMIPQKPAGKRRLLRSVISILHCLAMGGLSDSAALRAVIPLLMKAASESEGETGVSIEMLVLSQNDIVRMGAFIGSFRSAVKKRLIQSWEKEETTRPSASTLIAATSLCFHLLGFEDVQLLAALSKALRKAPDFSSLLLQGSSRKRLATVALLRRSFFGANLLPPEIPVFDTDSTTTGRRPSSPWERLRLSELRELVALWKETLPAASPPPRPSSTLHEEVFMALPEDLKVHAEAEETAGPFVVDSMLRGPSLVHWLSRCRNQQMENPLSSRDSLGGVEDGRISKDANAEAHNTRATQKKKKKQTPPFAKAPVEDAAHTMPQSESADLNAPNSKRSRQRSSESTARTRQKKRSEQNQDEKKAPKNKSPAKARGSKAE